MCEGLSGFKFVQEFTLLVGTERLIAFRDFHSKSKVRALNLADIKNLSNPSMKSIAQNLFPALEDLCIWGNYQITSDGFLEICTARGRNLKRVN